MAESYSYAGMVYSVGRKYLTVRYLFENRVVKKVLARPYLDEVRMIENYYNSGSYYDNVNRTAHVLKLLKLI